MIIFDTIFLSWSYGNKLTMPMARHGYTATLLSDSIIVYLGGLNYGYKAVNISDVILYDIISDTWETMVHIHNKIFLFYCKCIKPSN